LQSRGDHLTINDYSSNTLAPEVVEISSSGKRTINVYSDNFFSRLVCGYPTGDTSDGKVEISGLEEYVQRLDWRQRWYYTFMKTRARFEFWVQRELFKRIATFVEQK
jgi:hypothetical protein